MFLLPGPLLRALSLVPGLSLLPVLPLLPALSLLVPVAGAGPPVTPERWVWPLRPEPVVVARFDPPADAWGAGHRGVDLAAAVGQQVRAPRGGTVTFAGVIAGRPVVVISHPDGLRSTLEPVLPAADVGTSVRAGDVVGTMDALPGHCSPATCLHWGVLRGATYLDPLAFVVPRRVVLLPLSASGLTAKGPGEHRRGRPVGQVPVGQGDATQPSRLLVCWTMTGAGFPGPGQRTCPWPSP